MAASTSDTSIGYHQVFVSHRGVKMKFGFASRLHEALKSHGINTFLDLEDFPMGVEVPKYMLEAARKAVVGVPIFSEKYGTSSWCLDELIAMMDGKRSGENKVLPVFFDVKPEELRDKEGEFAKKFEGYVGKCMRSEDDIQRWKGALTEASWLAGFRLETYGGNEGRLIGDLVKKIREEIWDSLPEDMVPKPIGLDHRVQDLAQRLRMRDGIAVYVVLVWGMGGIGKTTLAKALYLRYRKDFAEASIVYNCADSTPILIQSQLRKDLLRDERDLAGNVDKGRAQLKDGLKSKKVLIVLDDVEDYWTSVEKVMDATSLCPGSRILLTSRDQTVFPHRNVLSSDFDADKYELKEMAYGHALQLFCLHAFRQPVADPPFEEEATKVVRACGGLPLSIEVLGRHLSKSNQMEIWNEAVTKLSDGEYKDIQGRLKISYEALDCNAQEMFLDIACCMIGAKESQAEYFWDACSKRAYKTGLKTLIDRCLVKRDDEMCLTMHDQLRDFGRAISRASKTMVWEDEELEELINSQQLDKIRGIVTGLPRLDVRHLSKMPSLRILSLDGTKLIGSIKGLKFPGIRWLSWMNCPHTTLPGELFSNSLAVLMVQGYEITRLPGSLGGLKRLRVLDIGGCMRLAELPECVGGLECLEELRARDCISIARLPGSLGGLKRLRVLDIRFCRRLAELPECVGGLECLEELCAVFCDSITRLPESLGGLKRLRVLDIEGCMGLAELPECVGGLECLEELRARRCYSITRLPGSLGGLKRLRVLDIGGCMRLAELPECVGGLECLEELRARRCCSITRLPGSLGGLKRLRVLDIRECRGLPEQPECVAYLNGLEVCAFLGQGLILGGEMWQLQTSRLSHID